MHVYTSSEAKQNFSLLLEQAKKDGGVQINAGNGQFFMVTPTTIKKSPLDIAGVDLNLSIDEIVDYVREGRERA